MKRNVALLLAGAFAFAFTVLRIFQESFAFIDRLAPGAGKETSGAGQMRRQEGTAAGG